VSLSAPTVTVVIPTRNRPTLLSRALASALAQTFHDLEVVVVVDGPDPETLTVLEGHRDARLRYHVNPSPIGGAGARNVAVRLARGRWIALLDDDDVWLPTKLTSQMPGLEAGSTGDRVGFTRLIARAPHGDYLWPRRAPRPGEHISDYLFVRRSLFAGEGGVQTSTLVAPRELLLAHPFDEELPRLQDTDWLLRVCAAGAELEFCPGALTVWHIEEARQTITSAHGADWRQLLEWIRERRHLVTDRAYAAFLLVRGGTATSAARDMRGARIVWRAAWAHGAPGPLDVLLFLSRWAAPPQARAWIRARLSPGRMQRGRDVEGAQR